MANSEQDDEREPLTPESSLYVAYACTPASPEDPPPSGTKLEALGVVDDAAVQDYRDLIQDYLDTMGWVIEVRDIVASPSTTLEECRDSILKHAKIP